MRTLSRLFQNNRQWSEEIRRQDPEFFPGLSRQQSPDYLWIGCADSRVPANEIVGLSPGELFVHRNVANVVVHTDLNCLSVMQYAVEVIKVRHIIVCGHYGCGGVLAAMRGDRLGLIDNWLRHIQDVRQKHEARLAALTDAAAFGDRLCEFNVIEQVLNVCQTTIVSDAWQRGQDLSIHGWVYSLVDGLLRDLKITITGLDETAEVYRGALAALEQPMQLLESTFPAGDGVSLFERCCLPNAEPRGEVMFVHGFIEHGGRYLPIAEALANRGFAASILDLRGHGRSGGPRCWLRSFDEYLDDMDRFYERALRRAAGKPLFLFGHSLGGLIALLCARRQPPLAGLILSGPVLEVGSQLYPWLRRLARVASVLFPRLRLVRMGGRYISRDPAVVQDFRDDPLVFHGRFPVRTGAEILRAGESALGHLKEARAPLLILHGTADRISATAASLALFEQAESRDKQLHLYPGLYHDLLNEPERMRVRGDVIRWIEIRA